MKVIWPVVMSFLGAKTESFSERRRIGLIFTAMCHVKNKHVSKSLVFTCIFLRRLRSKKNENSKCCLNISFKLNIESFLCQKLLQYLLIRFTMKDPRGIFPGKVCQNISLICMKEHFIE